MVKNILVPLDGLVLVETAVPHAIVLARQANAQLHLVWMMDPVDPAADRASDYGSVYPAAQASLDTLHAQASSQGVTVQAAIRSGHSVEQVLHYTAQHAVDLIVMATHPGPRLHRILLENTLRHVLREAACPVLLIQGQSKVPDYSVIVVPLDGTPIGEAVLPVAAELARKHYTRLVLLRAVLPSTAAAATTEAVLPLVDFSVYETPAGMDAARYMHTLAEPLRAAGFLVETICGQGGQKEVITAYAGLVQPDLIALASLTGSPTGLDQLAESVLQSARRPLLLYPYHGTLRMRQQEYEQRAALAGAGTPD